MVLRVMFDTNAYDAILAAGDLPRLQARIDTGEIAVVTTPIQEDEIRQIKDRNRQQRLLDLYHALDGETIDPTLAIAADITYMARDETLARVAAQCCDLLVTEDKRLASEAPTIDYAAFAERISLRD